MLKIHWSGVAKLVEQIVITVLASVIDVEKHAPILGDVKGDAKQQAALELVLACLRSMDQMGASDAANNPAVREEITHTIDQLVALMNTVERAHLKTLEDAPRSA